MFKCRSIIEYDQEMLEIEDCLSPDEEHLMLYVQDIVNQGGLVKVQFQIEYVNQD